MENTIKLAVLIDADNAQPIIIDSLLSEIANYGVASVKRIYGDWTTPGLKGWKEILLQHFIVSPRLRLTSLASQINLMPLLDPIQKPLLSRQLGYVFDSHTLNP